MRQKTFAKVNTELTSTLLLMVSMHNSAFAATVIDSIAQPLAARAEITLGLSVALPHMA